VAKDRLYQMPATGGERVAVTQNDPARTGTAHHFPTFLPDQRHFLFYATGGPEVHGIYLGSLDGRESKRLMAAETYGVFLPPDRVLFINEGALVSRQLDLGSAELVGDPVTIATDVGYDRGTGYGGFSVSTTGTIVYRTGLPRRQFAWYDRTGTRVGLVGGPDANDLSAPALSPDGRRIAGTRNVRNGLDIWIMDLRRGSVSPFTSEAETEGHPVWSPDGASIAFESSRENWKMRIKPSSGVGADALLHAEADLRRPQDWSTDGRFLIHDKLTSSTGHDVWFLERTSTGWTSKAFVATAAEELNAQLSPDGRWIAYETNESGRYQVVVQSFPGQTRTWPVSIDGGAQPRWGADGRELYFVAPDRRMMAVGVAATRSAFEASRPAALFATHIVSSRLLGLHAQYVVAKDGRFLVNETADELTAPITLILNWGGR
jgi:Tol biopolymer transport system component